MIDSILKNSSYEITVHQGKPPLNTETRRTVLTRNHHSQRTMEKRNRTITPGL